MRYLFFTILFALFATKNFAQMQTRPPINLYKYAIRFNPLTLMDPSDMNITTGFEWNYKTKHSVGADVSLIYNSTYYTSAPVCSPIGFIFRPFYRYYYSSGKYSKSFIQPELFYKQVDYRIEDWLNISNGSTVSSYQQYSKFTVRKQIGAANFKIGTQSELFKNSNLLIEAYLGLGIRLSSKHLVNAPPNSSYNETTFFFSKNAMDATYVTPNLIAGITIAYTFNKKLKKKSEYSTVSAF